MLGNCKLHAYLVIISLHSCVQLTNATALSNHHHHHHRHDRHTAVDLWRDTGADSISSRFGGGGGTSDRLGGGQSRRRQSPATLLSHKQNLITGSANTPLSSPYNQFYLTNSVNSPHNGK